MAEIRYPRGIRVDATGDEALVWVQDGGVRIDNAMLTAKGATQLHRWLGRYLIAAEEDARRYREAQRRASGKKVLTPRRARLEG